jgi:hypothetical protein
VAAIGDMLLHEEIDGETLSIRVRRALRRNFPASVVDRDRFIRLAWWLAAMFHDCGYAYEYHHKVYGKLAEAYGLPLSAPASGEWHECHGDLAGLVRELRERDFGNCAEARHAVVGAAELAREECEYERTAGEKEDKDVRKRRRALLALAVRAILRHHYPAGKRTNDSVPPQSESIRFGENPLGFLLILSDEIDEAQRVCGRAKASDDGTTVVEYVPSGIESVTVAADGPDPTLTLTYHPKPKTTTIHGKPTKEWQEQKQTRLRDSLRLGKGELFRDIEVRCDL